MDAILLVFCRLVSLSDLLNSMGSGCSPLFPFSTLVESTGQFHILSRFSDGISYDPPLLVVLLYKRLSALEWSRDLCASDFLIHYTMPLSTYRGLPKLGPLWFRQPQVGPNHLLMLRSAYLPREIRLRVLPVPLHHMDDILFILHAILLGSLAGTLLSWNCLSE